MGIPKCLVICDMRLDGVGYCGLVRGVCVGLWFVVERMVDGEGV